MSILRTSMPSTMGPAAMRRSIRARALVTNPSSISPARAERTADAFAIPKKSSWTELHQATNRSQHKRPAHKTRTETQSTTQDNTATARHHKPISKNTFPNKHPHSEQKQHQHNKNGPTNNHSHDPHYPQHTRKKDHQHHHQLNQRHSDHRRSRRTI